MATTADNEVQSEISELRTLISSQQARLDALEASDGGADGAPIKRSRRDLLKLVGAGAAAAAGASALGATTASALGPPYLSIGSENLTGTSNTSLYSIATNSFTLLTLGFTNSSGFHNRLKLGGTGTGTGLVVNYNSNHPSAAILATSGRAAGIGVAQNATNPFAPAASLASRVFVDAVMRGSGRLGQVDHASGGAAPTFTPYQGGRYAPNYHELVRGSGSEIWASRFSGAGQAAWKRINAVRFDVGSGTGAAFPPATVIDTRFGTGGLSGPLAGGSTGTDYAFPTALSGANNIPSTATAVIGYVQAIGFNTSGYITMFAQGGSAGTTLTTAFGAPGTIYSWSSFAIVPLNGSGKVSVFVSGNSLSTHVKLDVIGYVE